MGAQQGKLERKLELLLAACQRRLKRALTKTERDVIKQRTGSLGTDRLLDVQVERLPDARAAWLADPAAR